MITVRLYATLAPTVAEGPASGAGSAQFLVEARPGLTVTDVLAARGVPLDEVSVVVVNGVRADVDALLVEGDEVGVFPALSGG